MSNPGLLNRIERELGVEDLVKRLADLSPTDLQSLLLEVYRQQAGRRSPTAVLADHEADRFARPSLVSPRTLLRWEQTAFEHLPERFKPVALSPVCSLGTNSAIALVDQNKVMSTIYNTEVVSDSTNVLALEAALQRRALLKAAPKSAEVVNLAASQRLLRTQRYSNPKSIPHFSAFALCSAGRDTGRWQFELTSFASQISFYLKAIPAFAGWATPLRVAVTDFKTGSQPSLFIEKLLALLQPSFSAVEFVADTARTSGRDYYGDWCFHVYAANASGDFLELADGGVVNWTQRLLSNAKERCVISGIGSERVCTEFGLNA